MDRGSGPPTAVGRRRVLAGSATGIASLVLPAAAVHASSVTPLASPSTLVLALDAGDPDSYAAGSGTWTDLSGDGNHVTLPVATTSPTFDAGGWFAFDPASSQRLDVPSAVPTAIAAAAGAYTKEAWVRFDAGGANGSYNILSTRNDVLFLGLSDGVITLYGSPGGSPYSVTTVSTGALTASTWHHVAFASDGASLHRLFVGGRGAGRHELAHVHGWDAPDRSPRVRRQPRQLLAGRHRTGPRLRECAHRRRRARELHRDAEPLRGLRWCGPAGPRALRSSTGADRSLARVDVLTPS